jgi:hypothetical protein
MNIFCTCELDAVNHIQLGIIKIDVEYKTTTQTHAVAWYYWGVINLKVWSVTNTRTARPRPRSRQQLLRTFDRR